MQACTLKQPEEAKDGKAGERHIAVDRLPTQDINRAAATLRPSGQRAPARYPRRMYAPFFGLSKEPFSIAPDPRFLFMSEQHREALAHLLYGLGGGGGFVLLTGEIGAGKTTVCRCFLEQVPAETAVAYVFNPKLNALELLQSVCAEFGIAAPEQGSSLKAHVDALNGYLLDMHAAGRQPVLVIDEAQALSADVLEQLRLLTNLETTERKLLQIVLIGQPELRDMLARPELEQLAQRVIARFHLGALSRGETEAYIRHRLSVAGPRAPLPFDAAALALIHRLSGGVPRRINLLADRALLGAYAQGRQRVDRPIVRKAAGEVFAANRRAPAAATRRWLQAAAAVAGLGLVATAAWVGGSRQRIEAASPATGVAALVNAPRDGGAKAQQGVGGGPGATLAVAPGAASAVGLGAAASAGFAAASAAVSAAVSGAVSGAATDAATGARSAAAVGAGSSAALSAGPGAVLVADLRAAAVGGPGATASATPGAAAGSGFTASAGGPAAVADAAALLAAALAEEATSVRELALRWNVAIGEGDPCIAAAQASLACFRSEAGGLTLVRQLARPVMVVLRTPGRAGGAASAAAPRLPTGMAVHALLVGLDDRHATLQTGAQRFVLTLPALAETWRGEFATFWRAPPGWRAGSAETTGNAVLRSWLQQQLAVAGFDGARPLRERLTAFQVAHGLLPDGVAGPVTLMRLNHVANVDEPRLEAGR